MNEELLDIKQATVAMQQLVFQNNKKLNGITSVVNDIKNRIEFLELDEEISTMQSKEIARRIRKKVSEHLNYPSPDAVKYYRVYIGYLYAKLRSDYGLAESRDSTPKRNYKKVLSGIEEIIFPDTELMDHVNKLSNAKAAV